MKFLNNIFSFYLQIFLLIKILSTNCKIEVNVINQIYFILFYSFFFFFLSFMYISIFHYLSLTFSSFKIFSSSYFIIGIAINFCISWSFLLVDLPYLFHGCSSAVPNSKNTMVPSTEAPPLIRKTFCHCNTVCWKNICIN